MHIIYSVMYNAHLSQTIDLKFFKNIQMHMFPNLLYYANHPSTYYSDNIIYSSGKLYPIEFLFLKLIF